MLQLWVSSARRSVSPEGTADSASTARLVKSALPSGLCSRCGRTPNTDCVGLLSKHPSGMSAKSCWHYPSPFAAGDDCKGRGGPHSVSRAQAPRLCSPWLPSAARSHPKLPSSSILCLPACLSRNKTKRAGVNAGPFGLKKIGLVLLKLWLTCQCAGLSAGNGHPRQRGAARGHHHRRARSSAQEPHQIQSSPISHIGLSSSRNYRGLLE
jgi:hypothetical protein